MSTPRPAMAEMSRPTLVAASSPHIAWRVAMVAGRAEAARLCRSPLVLAGFVASAVLIWWNSRNAVPQWTVWNVQIGSSLLAAAGPVLIAAQLAAGRVRRDGAELIYDSYPSSAGVRTVAALLGLAGPLVLAAALTGAAVAWLELLGPVGAPRLAVLAQGVMLVALAGAVGVALGSYLPHPMAGLLSLAVLGTIEVDLLLPFGAPVQMPADVIWLFPWNQPWSLGSLPDTPTDLPPGAHLGWLAALTALAGIVAIWRTARRLIALTAVATAVVVAVAGWSAWAQLGPLPAATQASLVSEVIDPGHVQQCVARQHVRYCYYPGYQADATRWATVVSGVLGQLPAPPAKPLVVRQVVDAEVVTYPLFSGSEPQFTRLSGEVNDYLIAQADDPHLFHESSVPPVYVDLSWGTNSSLGAYQLGLALQTAWWVAGLPTTSQPQAPNGTAASSALQQNVASCLAVGQAREAIALWLAASATPGTRTAFPVALRYGPTAADVGTAQVLSYLSVPVSGYAAPVGFTAQGAALAEAMLRLPAPRVKAVLSAQWRNWLSPRATDAQLAAALGIALPPTPSPVAHRRPPASGLAPRETLAPGSVGLATASERTCR